MRLKMEVETDNVETAHDFLTKMANGMSKEGVTVKIISVRDISDEVQLRRK